MVESFNRPTDGSQPLAQGNLKLSAQVFNDPQDFLQTLKTHFKELSRGDNKLNLTNLQLDSTDTALDAKTRAAATLAADHYNDLAGIHRQRLGAGGGTASPADGISTNDLKFAVDMNQHNTFGYSLTNSLNDTAVGAGALLLTGFGGVSALLEDGILANMVPIGLGVAGVGLGVYELYGAIKESSRMNDIANTDAAKFKGWL